MYLEGSDQHRGWFHSSLLESCGTRGRAPFESILSHGFVVDGKGLKMSKSTGNVILPEEVLKKYGADILRIWVASSNYAEDLRIDYSILDQHAESYRKIRNTFRYLLGNIQDDFIEKNFEDLNIEDLPDLEKYMLHRVYLINKNFYNYFSSYNFHNLYKELLNFCTVELSAFYFDIRKDLLYCDPLDSKKRSDCILVLNIILNCLLKWFAPILSFTTEEIYRLINKEEENSIHLKNFIKIPENWKNEKLNSNWEKIKKIRDEANISIENQRANKTIGSSLEADIQIKLKNNYYKLAKKNDFSEICITSLANVAEDNNMEHDIQVTCKKAKGKKCPVCWKISETSCEKHGHLTF
tara:strand:- start:3 stop:1061 length:1059 start_codon:yes stop_codon:yes gene_type:complete